jgi:protein-S-isoprenylcysteine O-methyltransferase Ste14
MNPVVPPRRPHPVVSIVSALLVLALDAALLVLGLGSVPALLGSPAALALLAVWGVSGVTLALLRPVRSSNLAASDPDAPVMALLFFVPLATPMVAALGARARLWLLPAGIPWGAIGVALAAAGVAIRIAAMAQLGARFSPLVSVQKEHALERRGLYGIVRHPGYAGSWLACLGGSLAFGSAFALPLPALMALALGLRVRREERLLAAHFGAAWAEYAARTGALLPRPAGFTRGTTSGS